MTKFVVTRTSVWDDEVPPCKEAYLGTIDHWDIRTFKSPEEHDAKLGHRGKWTDLGTDHQIIRGPRGGAQGIKRNIGPRAAWFVELDTLDDLLAFQDKYGDLVITQSLHDESQRVIEIYDDYRE